LVFLKQERAAPRRYVGYRYPFLPLIPAVPHQQGVSGFSNTGRASSALPARAISAPAAHASAAEPPALLAAGRSRFLGRTRTAKPVNAPGGGKRPAVTGSFFKNSNEPLTLSVNSGPLLSTRVPGKKMINPKPAPLSLPTKLLLREIKTISAHINRSASLDELDRAWATLCRLQEALALATTRAKSLAD
jgi:hypothetical protein